MKIFLRKHRILKKIPFRQRLFLKAVTNASKIRKLFNLSDEDDRVKEPKIAFRTLRNPDYITYSAKDNSVVIPAYTRFFLPQKFIVSILGHAYTHVLLSRSKLSQIVPKRCDKNALNTALEGIAIYIQREMLNQIQGLTRVDRIKVLVFEVCARLLSPLHTIKKLLKNTARTIIGVNTGKADFSLFTSLKRGNIICRYPWLLDSQEDGLRFVERVGLGLNKDIGLVLNYIIENPPRTVDLFDTRAYMNPKIDFKVVDCGHSMHSVIPS